MHEYVALLKMTVNDLDRISGRFAEIKAIAASDTTLIPIRSRAVRGECERARALIKALQDGYFFFELMYDEGDFDAPEVGGDPEA